jgi:hypothetical protein
VIPTPQAPSTAAERAWVIGLRGDDRQRLGRCSFSGVSSYLEYIILIR